jgi:hypothetical protein
LETRYFNGARILFLPDLLSATTFKLDEDGDATFESTLATTDYNLYPLNDFPKIRAEISANSDYGGFASGIKKGVEIAGNWGYGDGLSATPYIDSGDDVADDPLAAGATTLTVSAAENFAAGQTLLIGTEQIYIEDLGDEGETLDIKRGVNGTTDAEHAQGADIYIYEYPEDIVTACLINSIRAISAGKWLDVTGSSETAIQTVKKGLHPEVENIINEFVNWGF